jgi:hypothetical protein
MKLETAVIITKGACFVTIGAATPMVTGLAQWIDSGQWPPTINWVGIGLGAAMGAATQVLAFLSQSFGDYKISMKNGNGESGQASDQPKQTTPGQ